MNRIGRITFGLMIWSMMMACPQAQNVLGTCEQLKRLLICESQLREILPPDMNCDSLKPKFEYVCDQKDIDVAYEVFKNQADKVCALKQKEQIPQLDLKALESKISKRCFHANIEGKLITDTLEGMDEL